MKGKIAYLEAESRKDSDGPALAKVAELWLPALFNYIVSATILATAEELNLYKLSSNKTKWKDEEGKSKN